MTNFNGNHQNKIIPVRCKCHMFKETKFFDGHNLRRHNLQFLSLACRFTIPPKEYKQLVLNKILLVFITCCQNITVVDVVL